MYITAMSIEIPSCEFIGSQILRLNVRLLLLRREVSLQGLNGVNLDHSYKFRGEDNLKPDLTPSGFWKHYIGGGIGSIASLPSDMVDLIPPVQERLHVLTELYITHPIGSTDQLNLESCRAFLVGGLSFDWTQSETLLIAVKNIVADLGDNYSLRERKIPLGYRD